MKRNYNNLYTLKYKIANFFACYKYCILFCVFMCLIGIITGIFTSVKLANISEDTLLDLVKNFFALEEIANTAGNFLGRFFSCLIVVLIITIFSIKPFLYPIPVLVLVYRSFLISINMSLIFMFGSVASSIKSLLIIVPCQLGILFFMIIYFCYIKTAYRTMKYYKRNFFQSIILPFLICNIVLILINLIETIMLVLFNSQIILVI